MLGHSAWTVVIRFVEPFTLWVVFCVRLSVETLHVVHPEQRCLRVFVNIFFKLKILFEKFDSKFLFKFGFKNKLHNELRNNLERISILESSLSFLAMG